MNKVLKNKMKFKVYCNKCKKLILKEFMPHLKKWIKKGHF